MDNKYKEKLDFIISNYELFRSLHYSYRFALLEYIFFDIEALTEDNINRMMQHYKFFDKKAVDYRLPVHEELPSDVSYENIKSMLMEYKKYLEDVLKLNIYNKDKLNKIRSIVCSILNECYKLSDIIVENTDINRRKK